MQHALDRPGSALSTGQVRRAVALVLVVVLGVALWLSRGGGRTISPSSQMSSHQLPELGIEFDYPSNWHLQDFDDHLGLASMTGALVSNVQHDFHHPDLGPTEGTSAWDMRGLPDDLIVISFEQLDRTFLAKRSSGLPLDLENAVVSPDAEHHVDTYGAPQPRLFLPFAVEGQLGSGVQVFIGDVGAHERDAVEAVLASVRPSEADQPATKGGIAMGEPIYVSKVHVTRKKGPLRDADLPGRDSPVTFGVHSEIARHYGVSEDEYSPDASTLDYVVAAAGG